MKTLRPSWIITLIGGCCTFGPGQVASEKLSVAIRSHHDISKNKTDKLQFMDSALKYYDGISWRAISRGIVIDMFVSSIDQSGIYEMKSLFEKTGGYYIMTDSF